MKTINTYFDDIKQLDKFISKQSELQESDSLLIQIFSGVLDKQILQELSYFLLYTLPQAKIIGATTSGEILDHKVSDEKIVVSFSIFEKSTLSIANIVNDNESNSFDIGKSLANKLLQEDSKVFILFGSGLLLNGDKFLEGVHSIANNIVVAGGQSADNGLFSQTYLICGDDIIENGAVGISINSNELYVNNQYSLQWSNIGKTFTVEKAKGNTVYQIDGMTPYDLYKKYLGEEIATLLPNIGVEFPLIIQKEYGMQVSRAAVAVGDNGSLIYSGNFPIGSKVRFAVGNANFLIDGSSRIATDIASVNTQSIFIYSCMARKVFLGSKTYLDIKDFSKICDVAGFFTYGEFYTSQNHYELLNSTLTLLSLSEEKLQSKTIDTKNTFNKSDSFIRQKALSNLIEETSQELDSLNLQLENKVIQKTKDLDMLNETLEQKVLEKTKEQDILLSLFDKGDSVLFKWNNDEHWSIDYVSSSVEKLLGYTKGDFTNKQITYNDCIHKDDISRVIEEVNSGSIAHKEFFKHEPYRVIRKNGDIRWVIDYTVIIRDNNDNITHYLGYINDITEEKTKDKLLANQIKLASMNEMLGNIAHQWRQPLSVISTSASGMLLQKEMNILSDKKFEKYITGILDTTQSLSETINTFKNYIEEKNESKDIILQDKINSAISMIELPFKNDNIELINNTNNTKPIPIKIFDGDLSQVLVNILTNAKEIMIKNDINDRWINIELSQKKNTIIITIEDNGGGISEDVLPKIFDPYFTTKHQYQGTGLGLHVSYQIVTQNFKGKLYAKNTKNGAKLFIEIPLT